MDTGDAIGLGVGLIVLDRLLPRNRARPKPLPKPKPIFKMPKMKNKKGQLGIMVGLLMGFMVITMLITLVPGFVQMFNTVQQSTSLNCAGYVDPTDHTLDYNASLATNTIACLGMKLYLPYIIFAVLIGVVMAILYNKSMGPQMSQGGY